MKHLDKRKKTQWVIILTAVTMVVEIIAGFMTGSLALLADGWHMASHVGALSIAWVGYYLVDQAEFRSKFAFGGGKVLGLGGYTSSVLLLLTAFWMIKESIERFLNPQTIDTREAMIVAAIGLVVNLVSALILEHGHDHHHHHHAHEHAHDHCDDKKHSFVKPAKDHVHIHHHHHKDLNMAGAYAHVLADALTSVLAIVALFLAEWKGWLWADPFVGLLGAVMIIRWGMKLFKDSAMELLDAEARDYDSQSVKTFLEKKGLSVGCVHSWKLDGEKTALHVKAFSEAFAPEELPKLRQEMLKLFPVTHLVIEIGRDKDHCQL